MDFLSKPLPATILSSDIFDAAPAANKRRAAVPFELPPNRKRQWRSGGSGGNDSTAGSAGAMVIGADADDRSRGTLSSSMDEEPRRSIFSKAVCVCVVVEMDGVQGSAKNIDNELRKSLHAGFAW